MSTKCLKEGQEVKNTYKIDIQTPDPGYEPFPVSIMNRSTYEATTFDPSLGKPAAISYRLNKGGCIRIRLVRKNQTDLVIRTLQDWTDQDFGKYELKWDGRDSSGNIVDNKNIFVLFEAKDKDKGLLHAEHDKGSCKDPKLNIKITPEPNKKVKGSIEILTTVSGVNNFGNSNGCEVRYFIDYAPLQTQKFDKGVNNFNLKIDTIKLKNGEHLITVNVHDFSDHVGSAGIKIDVES